MSERIVDEKFVEELDGDRQRRRLLDKNIYSLQQLVEKDSSELLVSPKGRIRSALKKLLFRLIKPALAPFLEHQKQLEREKLQLLSEMWSCAEERLGSLESKLIQVYVKAGESMAQLRKDILEGGGKEIIQTGDDVSAKALREAIEENRCSIKSLQEDVQRLAGDMLSRFDLMIGRLEKDVEALRRDLERHTSLSGKRLEVLKSDIDSIRAQTTALRDRTRLLTRELISDAGIPGEMEPGDIDVLSSQEYAAHQERFRGAPELVARRQRIYIDYFRECDPVLDIGCGRGEFIELLAAEGIAAYGIDSNEKVVKDCREKGLEAEHSDLFDHLKSLKGGSLGGVFAAQLVEHLAPAQLRAFLGQCHRVLRKDGVLVAETLNPESVFALTRYFYQDSSHQAPLPAPLLQFLAELAGFAKVEIRLLTEAPEAERLQAIELESALPAALEAAFARLNSNVDRLNRFLYGHMEYAIIARK